MENQIEQLENYVNNAAKVFESFGGYSPTLGIIGAVMGLIQVMQNLSDPSKLGAGIAVAFVATIYGLFAANLVMIPISTRIKFIYQGVFLYKNMILEKCRTYLVYIGNRHFLPVSCICNKLVNLI